MSYCIKWEDVEITGFKVLKWNEMLLNNDISEEQGLFVFRRHPDGHIKRILRFNLRYLINPTLNLSTGDFQARLDGLAFSSALFRSGLFWMRRPDDERIVRDLTAFVRSCFEFSGYTVNCPFAPRLVFVIDFTYTPVIHVGCPPSDLPSVSQRGTTVCSVSHPHVPGIALSEQAEDNALRECVVYETDNEEDEVYSGDMGHEMDPDDVEMGYTAEVREIATSLRRYRNVGRSFPLLPLSPLDPLGLVEVVRPVMETLRTTTPFFDCPICTGGMEAGEVVLRAKCGHVFHRDCVIPWLSTYFTCPLCSTYSPHLL